MTATVRTAPVATLRAGGFADLLDRHWRNIRTLTLHNPTADQAVAIGDHVVNGAPLPANAYF